MIHTVFSVAMQNEPWTESPAPPPIVIPFMIATCIANSRNAIMHTVE